MKNSLTTTKTNAFDTKENYSDYKPTDLMSRRSHKIKVLVDALRMVSEDCDISKETLLIPDDCEQYGFVEGKHNLGILLHFLADMIEE
jgi:hypothetical protein